jgi:hypothetical protein
VQEEKPSVEPLVRKSVVVRYIQTAEAVIETIQQRERRQREASSHVHVHVQDEGEVSVSADGPAPTEQQITAQQNTQQQHTQENTSRYEKLLNLLQTALFGDS